MAHIQYQYNDVQESPIEAGIRQYYQAQNIANERQMQQQKMALEAASQGLIKGSAGDYVKDPLHEQMAEQQLQNLHNQETQFKAGLIKEHIQSDPNTGEPALDKYGQGLLQSEIDEQKARASAFRGMAAQRNMQAGQGMGQGGGTAMDTPQQQKTWDKVSQQLEMMRGNPAVQQAEKDLYSVQKLHSLSKSGKLDDLSPQMAGLYAQEVAKMAQGGVPTTSEMQGLLPHAIPAGLASAAQIFTNAPVPANLGSFIKQFKDYGDSIANDAQGIVTDRYGRILNSQKGHLSQSDYQAAQDNYLNRFNKSSSGGLIQAGQTAAGGGGAEIHNQALDWANSNPNDPRAAAIKQKAMQNMQSTQQATSALPQQSATPGGLLSNGQ